MGVFFIGGIKCSKTICHRWQYGLEENKQPQNVVC